MNHERHLELLECILTGEGGGRKIDGGIVGGSHYETQQMRAEWVRLFIPRTANWWGVEWDGIKRLGESE